LERKFLQITQITQIKRTFLGLAMPAENLSIDLTVTLSKSPQFWYGSSAQDKQALN